MVFCFQEVNPGELVNGDFRGISGEKPGPCFLEQVFSHRELQGGRHDGFRQTEHLGGLVPEIRECAVFNLVAENLKIVQPARQFTNNILVRKLTASPGLGEVIFCSYRKSRTKLARPICFRRIGRDFSLYLLEKFK